MRKLNIKQTFSLLIMCVAVLFGTNASFADNRQQAENLPLKYYFPLAAFQGTFIPDRDTAPPAATSEPTSMPATATATQVPPTATPTTASETAPIATATPNVQPTAEPTAQPTATPVSNTSPGGEIAGDAFYVSKNGNNSNGRSWGSAWNELNQIKWSELRPGSVVYIDGGSSSMTYRTALVPGASGRDGNPIVLQLSAESGRNGQAVFFGGNNVPLPECGQRSWDESQIRNAGENGIRLENGISNVLIDGRKRSGIVVHGWSRSGVYFNPDRSGNGRDDNPRNISLKYIEIYNNGGFERRSDGSSRDLYFPRNNGSGIELAGTGHKFQFMEIHDNAADAIQSAHTNPSGGTYNNMDNLTLTDSWLYNQRAHSGRDNSPSGETCNANNRGGCDELGAPHMGRDYHDYPSSPGNRREAFNWCTHSDGIQIYNSKDFNKLTIERSIIGPNFMTALILGDRLGGDKDAWVNDLTLRDVIITRYMHNALGMKNPSNHAGKNWKLENVTFYGHFNSTQKGTLNLDSNANYNEHRIANSIMVHGRTNFPNGNIEFSNNCEHAMYSNTIGGKNADPQFRRINGNDMFENNLNADFARVFSDNYAPQNPQCQSSGSRLTSAADLISRFNQD